MEHEPVKINNNNVVEMHLLTTKGEPQKHLLDFIVNYIYSSLVYDIDT